MNPVVVQLERMVDAPIETVWRAMSNTDAFNRTAQLGMAFERDPSESGPGAVRGAIRLFGQRITWDERPFQFTAPRRFRTERIFHGGPASRVVARFELSEHEGGTRIDYRVEITPRWFLVRPIVALDTRFTLQPKLSGALDAVVRSIQLGEAHFDPPPPLPPVAAALLRSRLYEVPEPARTTVEHVVTQLPLEIQDHLQPPRLAADRGISLDAAIDAAEQATKARVLARRFVVTCPMCWGSKSTVEDFARGAQAVHCDTCGIDFDGSLSDNVEVAYRVDAALRPDHAPIDCLQSPSNTPHVVAQERLPPGEHLTLELNLTPGGYRLECMQWRGPMHIEVVAGRGFSSLAADVRTTGMLPYRGELRAGLVRIFVRSRLEHEVTVYLAHRARPPYALTLGQFLADRGEMIGADTTGQKTMEDGILVAVADNPPWVGPRRGVRRELIDAGASAVHTWDGFGIGLFSRLPAALEGVHRVQHPDRSVVVSRGTTIVLGAGRDVALIGPAVDEALATLRQIGWGRKVVCDSVKLSDADLDDRFELLPGSGSRPTYLKAYDTVAPDGSPDPRDVDQAGPYHLEKPIGRGALGTVYLARHPGRPEPVVVKLLHPEHAARPDYVVGFYREAQLGWMVRHPNVVRLHDWGFDPDTQDLYVVMEKLEGESLRARVKRDGPLGAPALRQLALDVLAGLAAVHETGILHRDLKPSNVMLTDRGAVIVDFGIAIADDDEYAVVAGTPSYASPEQRRSGLIDARSDLYQLAVMLCRVGTGEWPFPGRTPEEREAWRDANPVTALPSTLPAPLHPVLIRALSTEVTERYPSARAMAAALRQAWPA